MTKQQLFSKLICVILAQLIWCNTALAANANLELYRTQKQYFSENRTVSEKANPYNNPNVFKNNDEVNKFINETSNDRFLFKFSEKTKEIEVYDKNKNNELVTLIPLSTKEDLQTYKPSRLKEKLALMSKNIYGASKNGVKHTVLNLPMEASVFYMALGSVSALYLFTNAAENPAALKIFNDQQTSAVGVTSLFMFLASQNATSNVAQLFIKNPNWHIMLPYLGMTVGSMVQNYTTSLLTDPNIKACMNEMFNLNLKAEDANQNPCDKAYEYFTLQKPWEFAPGLASMIVSTIAASTIQYAASTGTLALEKKITSQIIKNEVKRDLVKMSLVRFAGFMNPGAVPFMAATGVWLYLTKASNLAFFAALDHKIYNKVTFATKNLQESVSLPLVSTIKKTSHELFETIISQKNENWKIARTKKTCALNKNNDCSGMIELLDKFQNEMKVWRTSNITDITETHQSWQTYLGDLVARYLASKEFYSRFINEAKKYAIKDGTENLLERKYLFWGVKTEHTKYIDETFYTDPHLPESEQIIKVRVFIDRILELTKNFKPRYKNKSDTYLIPAIKNYFVGNQLNSYEEKLKAAQGLIEVKKWLYDQRLNRITEFQYIYMAINAEFKKLGPVDPKIHAGEGFISAVDRSQKLQDFYKNIDLKRDNSIFKFKKYETYI